MVVLTYEDIIVKAEEFIKFGKDIHFLVKGYLAEDIVFYLDSETDNIQFMECGYEDEYIIDEYDNDKMYWVDIAPKERLYYVQEAVYEPQGILAQNDEDDIVYYQKNNILSKENENRILGNIFEFTYDEDVEDDGMNEEEEIDDINEEDCNCNECLAEKIEHLYAIIDEMDARLETLETTKDKECECNCGCTSKDITISDSVKESYKVNGKQVSKETYDKAIEDIDKKFLNFLRNFC